MVGQGSGPRRFLEPSAHGRPIRGGGCSFSPANVTRRGWGLCRVSRGDWARRTPESFPTLPPLARAVRPRVPSLSTWEAETCRG